MSTDASRKAIGLRIYQEFCRLFPTALGTVNPVEMSPFLMTMRLVKQYYGFSKPEVYGTLIALLQDYDPSLGVKHRERTMRYIKLLLVDQPEMADYLLYLLPECTRSNDNEESLQQPPQQLSTCSHCSAQTIRCDNRPTVDSLRKEPSYNGSLLQRMLVLPVSDTFQDFTSTAVRIAPAINSAASITSTANSVFTFGKSSTITLPQLVKGATGQVKQLQVHSKPAALGTLLYNPNVLIKSEVLTDHASSVVTLPRISSTVACPMTPISAVQDAGNSLARQLGLKLSTHVATLPKDGTNQTALSSNKSPLLRPAPRIVVESSCRRSSAGSLDDRLQNIIKRFGKETQITAGRVTSVRQQTAEKSIVPSRFFGPRLSCVRNIDAKETIVVQKQPEYVARSTHTSVTNSSLVRCMSAFQQNQPVFVIEKARSNLTTSTFDTAGIRIIKKSKVAAGGLPATIFDKQPSMMAESSPLMSLQKLVAGVGLLKGFDNESICRSSSMISNRNTELDAKVICEKAAVGNKLQAESVAGTESDGSKEASQRGVAAISIRSLSNHTNLGNVQNDETQLSGDRLEPMFESFLEKEVCRPSGLVDSEGRLSPFSDETSLLMNDGTSDYHVSDEEQPPTTDGSTGHEITTVSKCSPSGDASQSNATSAPSSAANQSNEEPLCKKMKVTSSTDNLQYEGSRYLARLMELPSPPNYGRDDHPPWKMIADDRKRKGKIAIKRKRKK